MTTPNSKWPALAFFALYWLILAGFFWKILGAFSWVGISVTGLSALFLAMAVRGMVKRKAEGRPVASLEFFWGIVTSILLGLSGLLFWAGAVTPDHIFLESAKIVEAPVEKVWSLISNPIERPKWDPYLEKVELVSPPIPTPKKKTATPVNQAGQIYKFSINATGTEVQGQQKIVEWSFQREVVFEIIDEASDSGKSSSIKNVRSGFYMSRAGSAYVLRLTTGFEVTDLFAKMMVALLSKKFMQDTLNEQITNIKNVAEGKIERVQSKAAHFLGASPTPTALPDQPGQGAKRESK